MPNFTSELDKLLAQLPNQSFSLIKQFVKRLIKHKESVFIFLANDHVPTDNNSSERGIRNAKVKTKVSGQFKTIENAQIFSVWGSVVDTLIKNDQPLLTSLKIIANFRPE